MYGNIRHIPRWNKINTFILLSGNSSQHSSWQISVEAHNVSYPCSKPLFLWYNNQVITHRKIGFHTVNFNITAASLPARHDGSILPVMYIDAHRIAVIASWGPFPAGWLSSSVPWTARKVQCRPVNLSKKVTVEDCGEMCIEKNDKCNKTSR